MERDILIRIIKTNKDRGSLGSAIARAAITPPPVKKKVVLKKNADDDKWMMDGLSWIENKCKNGIVLVNISSSTWFYSIGSFHKEVAKRFPLETISLGGLVWIEKAKFDTWIEDVKEIGKIININKVTNGTTMDYYPGMIFRYDIVSDSNLS